MAPGPFPGRRFPKGSGLPLVGSKRESLVMVLRSLKALKSLVSKGWRNTPLAMVFRSTAAPKRHRGRSPVVGHGDETHRVTRGQGEDEASLARRPKALKYPLCTYNVRRGFHATGGFCYTKTHLAIRNLRTLPIIAQRLQGFLCTCSRGLRIRQYCEQAKTQSASRQ